MFYHLEYVVGDITEWRVVPLPTQGDMRNVSAVVVPVRAGMAEHGRPYPMWSDDELEQQRQFAREQLEANRILKDALAATTRALDALSNHVARGPLLPGFAAVQKHRPVPAIPEWREWRSFVQDLQRLEVEWRRHNRGRFPKLVVAEQRGCDVATVTRAMVDTHGLAASDWPPSTWNPERPPIPRDDI